MQFDPSSTFTPPISPWRKRPPMSPRPSSIIKFVKPLSLSRFAAAIPAVCPHRGLVHPVYQDRRTTETSSLQSLQEAVKKRVLQQIDSSLAGQIWTPQSGFPGPNIYPPPPGTPSRVWLGAGSKLALIDVAVCGTYRLRQKVVAKLCILTAFSVYRLDFQTVSLQHNYIMCTY